MDGQITLERRDKARLEIQLGCIVRTRRKRPSKLIADTVNLSRSGVLLNWPAGDGPDKPQIGEIIDLDILLSTPPEFGERSISCHAVVVRVEANAAQYLVAAKIRRFSVGQIGLIVRDQPSERAVRAC